MNREQIYRRIVEIGIVPVVRASSADEAKLAVEAVREGGIPIVEITMTVPGAVEVIRDVVKTVGAAVLVGAGTVLDAESARRCLDAGAEFLVSPGFDRGMVECCVNADKPALAGALTPTEIITSWKSGASFVKVFPCANVGGAKYIKALRGPLPQVPLVPTGGVNLDTATDFIVAGAAALGVGGELIQASALKARQPEIIVEIARKFVAIVKQARESINAVKLGA